MFPAQLTNDTPEELEATVEKHRKAFLYEGHGHSAFAAIVAGLLKCAEQFRHSSIPEFITWGKVSSAASVRGTCNSTESLSHFFFKSFDYRLRQSTPENDRRHANLELIHHFIDSDVEAFCLGEDLKVVKM